MRVNDKLFGNSFVKVLVAFGSIVETYHGDVHRLGNLNLVVKNGLHQLAVIFQHRALAGVEGGALCPPETNADGETSKLGGFINCSRILKVPLATSSCNEKCNENSVPPSHKVQGYQWLLLP